MVVKFEYAYRKQNKNKHRFISNTIDSISRKEIRSWMKENIGLTKDKCRLYFETYSYGYGFIEVYISNDNDAMAFKLRWL